MSKVIKCRHFCLHSHCITEHVVLCCRSLIVGTEIGYRFYSL